MSVLFLGPESILHCSAYCGLAPDDCGPAPVGFLGLLPGLGEGGCLAGLGSLGFNRQWSVKVEKEKGVRKCVVLSSHFLVQGYS